MAGVSDLAQYIMDNRIEWEKMSGEQQRAMIDQVRQMEEARRVQAMIPGIPKWSPSIYGAGANHSHSMVGTMQEIDPEPLDLRGMRLLKGRLRYENKPIPLPHLNLYITTEVAYVFGVDKSQKPFTLEDDPGLFPSDTLITQLRLMIG